MTMHGIRSCLRLCRPRAASSRRRATSRYACGTPSRARCVLTASASLALDYRRPPLTVTHRHAARTRPSITWTKWPLPTRSPSARLARSTYAAHARALSRTTHLTRAPLPASIYCGFQRAVRVFDVSRPGRQVATFESKSRHLGAQAGIISTIAVSPHTNLIAAGSYDKTVGIYDNAGSMVQLLRLPAPNTGVTQVKLAPSGTHVFAGVRKGNHVSCWDLRYVTAEPMAQFARQCTTNQRIQFDLDASCSVLVTGCETGHAIGYDLSSSFHEVFRVRSHNGTMHAHSLTISHSLTLSLSHSLTHSLTHSLCATSVSDVVNAVGCHPMLPLLATASGSREFDLRPFVDDGDVDSDDEQQQQHVNEPSLEQQQQQQCAPSHSLALWRVASLQLLTADVVTHAVIEATATAEIEPVAPLIVDASSIHEPSA